MKKLLIVILFLSGVFGSVWAKAQSEPASVRIVIMRHAEKPDQGDNLSCKGFNRSVQIPAMLAQRKSIPDYIYVPALETGKTTKSVRMLQTVGPLAIKYNLEVNSKYEVKETSALAENILNKKGIVLVVWEHNAILDLVEALGVSAKGLTWSGNDYDSIWIITVKGGKASLVKSKEGIKAIDSCRF